uniref:Uncharacterized protein n=1 Tax=Rhizophora mucronata TaxID=61149 RepID=A0A2P2N0G5_RHIMU
MQNLCRHFCQHVIFLYVPSRNWDLTDAISTLKFFASQEISTCQY